MASARQGRAGTSTAASSLEPVARPSAGRGARRGGRSLRSALLGGCALAVVASPVWAQTAEIEEITVTARKRAENLQDVPDAITAITAGDIEFRSVTNLGDLDGQIPNFTIRETQQPGTAFVAMRGVAMQRFQEPSVAITVDGVQLVSQYQILQAFYDVEQIEVLRGPQGALYGRNAIGGAINITTRQPGDELVGYAEARYGNGPDQALAASVSGPLVENRAYFSLLGAYRDFEGVIDNVTTGNEADFEELSYFRGRLLFDIGERVSLDLRASREDREGGVGYFVNLPAGDVNRWFDNTFGGTEGFGERDLQDVSAKLVWDLGGPELSFVAAHSELDDDYLQDIDYTALEALDGLQFVDVDAISGELRLTSADRGRLRWLAGVYYADIDQDVATVIAANPCFFVNPASCPLGGPVSAPARVDIPFGDNRNNNETYAIFGQINYDLSDATELTFGLRFDRDERTQFDVAAQTTDSETFDDLQPKLSLAHRWNPQAMGYVTISRGFRSGAFNGTDFVTRLYDAETLWNYELGAKLDLLDNRLRLNSALFYLDYTDRQEYVLQGGTGSQTLFNIPESTVSGFELELSALLTDSLSADLGIGFTDSEIEETNLAAEAALKALNGLDPSITFTGNELPNIARVTLNGGLDYQLAFSAERELRVRLGATYWDGIHWSLGNVNDEQDAVTLVNVNASLRLGAVTLSLYGENVFDEEYYEEVFLPGFGTINPVPGGFPARGRRAGVEIKLDF